MTFFKQNKRKFSERKIVNKEIYFSTGLVTSNNSNYSSPTLLFEFPSTGDIDLNTASKIKIDLSFRANIPYRVYDGNGYSNHYDRAFGNTTAWPGGVSLINGFWANTGGNSYWISHTFLVLNGIIFGKNSLYTKLQYSLDEGTSWSWLYEVDNGIGGVNIGVAASGDRAYNSQNNGCNHSLLYILIMDQDKLLGSNKIRFRLYGYGNRSFGRSTYITPAGGRDLQSQEIPYENFSTRSWSCPNNIGIAAASGDNFYKMHAIVTEFK